MASFGRYLQHHPRHQRIARWSVIIIALALFAWAYLHVGNLLLTQTNHTDKAILGADQKHNMKMALRTRADLTPDFAKGISEPIKDWFPHRTDGVVNPLWPWIAAWLADADHQESQPTEVTAQDRAFFHRGRWFHVGWTLGALIILGIACGRVFSVGGTLLTVLLVGFGAMLPRSAFFQPEPVFFALFALTWVSCLMALHRNSLWMHALIGVFGGAAYMAKGSVEPLLAGYIVLSTLRWAYGWWDARRHPGAPSTSLWVRRNHWLCLVVLLCCYLMTIGPRLHHAQQTYGNAFHSYPGYWMWMDDFAAGYRWMDAHNTKEELLAMTPSEKPSFTNYAATHTRDQMLTRLLDGTRDKLVEFFWPGYTTKSKNPKPWKGVLELRGVYLGALMLLVLLLAAGLRIATPRPVDASQRLHPETITHVLFVLGVLVGYSLAFGWYCNWPAGPIRGERFMLMLFAPLVLSLVWGCESIVRRAHRRSASAWFARAYQIALWGLIAAIAWRIVEIVQFPLFKD
jgi:hypothetical protein